MCIIVYIRGDSVGSAEYGRGKKGNGNGMFYFFFFFFLMCWESAWENLQRNRKVQKRLFRLMSKEGRLGRIDLQFPFMGWQLAK